MNDDYSFLKERRAFIKRSSGLVALGSMPAYLTANTENLQSGIEGIQQHEGIVLYSEKEMHSVAFADTMAKAGLETVALTDDLVRQWRDGLGNKISQSGAPVIGLSNWPDYLVLSGLAAEARLHVMMEMQHPVEQPGKDNWSARLAVGFLHLPQQAGREKAATLVKEFLADQKQLSPGEKSLFSWIIA